MLSQKVAHLQMRHPACPPHEIARRIELLPLFPQRQAGLLENLFGIVAIGQQRHDVGIDPALRADKLLDELILLPARFHRFPRRGEGAGATTACYVSATFVEISRTFCKKGKKTTKEKEKTNNRASSRTEGQLEDQQKTSIGLRKQ